MIIEFDAAKREKTLLERGLDFADSDKILTDFTLSLAMIVLITARSVFHSWTIGSPDGCDCLDSEKPRSPNYFYEVRQ